MRSSNDPQQFVFDFEKFTPEQRYRRGDADWFDYATGLDLERWSRVDPTMWKAASRIITRDNARLRQRLARSRYGQR